MFLCVKGEHRPRRWSFAMAPHQELSGSGKAQQCSCACSCGKKDAPVLFVDEKFPAKWNMLYNAAVATAWLRPHEIRKEPRLFVDGCSRFAVKQGFLGDCWFMAACAAIADHEDLVKQIVPEGQVLYGPGYDGSVTFRLWHQGEWCAVRVDDLLPVDEMGQPVYAHCQHKDEFWLPLLEKAFAKFHKHFGAIDGGLISEGIMNLTGYTIQELNIKSWDIQNLNENFQKIKRGSDLGALILCASNKGGPGIPGCHAYTITKAFYRDAEGEKLQLVRVRNPWGNSCKWKGAWKDGDERWDKLCKETKEALDYKPEENGEFWISMEDFFENFDEIIIATKNPFGAENMKQVGHATGEWKKEDNAGGAHTDIEKFARNPQFLLVVLGVGQTESEEEGKEEPLNPIEGVEAIVELLRGHCRKKCNDVICVAFYIFETCAEQRLTAQQMQEMTYVAGATDFHYQVSASCAVRLRPGRRYVVVPTTDWPGQPGDFLLRVFSRGARVRLTQLPAAEAEAEAATPALTAP